MIKLMKSTFYNELEVKSKLIEFISNSDILSMGLKVEEFERLFSKYQDRSYSVMFNSGSSANLALIQALKNLDLLKNDDPVGFSALTWSTNVMPLFQLGLKPVPLDISLSTLNISSKTLLKSAENNLRALFITNALGFSGDLDEIKKSCTQKGIILLEDNCESLGSVLQGKKLGNFSFASTFSFYVGHHLSTIEGGMVCTDDEELYSMLKIVRAHGWDRNLTEERKYKLRNDHNINDFYGHYSFYDLGFCLRPTELNAVIGIEQLRYIEEINEKRNNNFMMFQEAASGNPDFVKLNFEHMEFISNFAYPIVCNDVATLDKYKKLFSKYDVEIRPIIGGSMTQQPFFKKYSNCTWKCPNAEEVHAKGFYIPNNPELTMDELTVMCNLLKGANE